MHKHQERRDLDAFCCQEYPSLVSLLGLYCGDGYLAEELAQEALARACRDWRRVQKMDRPAAWLRRVAINLARSRFRRALIERRVNERASALSLDEHVDPDMANTIAVRRAIAALPHRQKTVLILIYYADMTSAQVADLLECPEGTVKSLAHRAIKRLSRNQTALRIEEGGGLEWRGA